MDMHLCNIPQTVLEDEYIILQELYTKGDDIQKLSVIQALPQLLQYDPNGTLTRIVPKIQQELPKSSCEFHIATSKIFKLLIEKQLPLNLTGAVLQGTESKDPVVSNAWIETLLAVIPSLPVDQIKTQVIPLGLAKAQPSSPVYCRVSACKILGKCASHPTMQSLDVKATILPAVQSLCQDCFQDVRATMCSQLHFIAKGLGENLVKTSLLPSLVELASDDNMSVRSAAVAAAVLIIPFLNKSTRIDTIVPLIKQLCQKAAGSGDTTFTAISKEFGKLVDALQHDLETADSIWALQFYKTLASKGQTVRLNKDNMEVNQDVLCREQCAFNLPAVTVFTVARIPDQLELWHTVFSGLANDSCYLVRKTTACCVHEVVRVLGSKCITIKGDLVKLLRDDDEEVLQMLVPHIGETLELFCTNGVLSRETTTPSSLEIARALLKCQMELGKSYNWRIKTDFLQQMEHLANCMPSDFIHQHFSPVMLNCVLEARAKPVRSQASRTLLIFLRFNLKEIQRKWIRDNLITHLCYAQSCYTRHIFILSCIHAMELFSNSYFKKHFFEPLLSLSDDPVSNIRLCVVGLLPVLFKMLVMPEDRKLQMAVDNVFSKLEMVEKDRDVKDTLRLKLKEIRTLATVNKHDYLVDQRRKEDEENKIYQGKSIVTNATMSHSITLSPSSARSSREQANRSHPLITRSTSAPPRTASRTSGGQPTSDMRFLEQHFYIDAGISLPREKIDVDIQNSNNIDICKSTEQKLNISTEKSTSENVGIPSVLTENMNIETMSEREIKKLETSTTNMTDDVKVDLKRRNKKSLNKIVSPKINSHVVNVSSDTKIRCKRFSNVYPSSLENSVNIANKKTLNRRSLNIAVGGDLSRIPVCIKKSKSNADVKIEEKGHNTNLKKRSSNIDETVKPSDSKNDTDIQNIIKEKPRIRPKSEILVKCNKNSDKWLLGDKSGKHVNSLTSFYDSIKNNVPITSNTNESTSKRSGLPVLQRRTVSEARK